MDKDKESKDFGVKQKRKFEIFYWLSKNRDKTYFSELSTQWDSMNKKQRGRFLLGVFVGVIIVLILVVLICFFAPAIHLPILLDNVS